MPIRVIVPFEYIPQLTDMMVFVSYGFAVKVGALGKWCKQTPCSPLQTRPAS